MIPNQTKASAIVKMHFAKLEVQPCAVMSYEI